MNTKKKIEYLFELGGLVAGGAAVAKLYNIDKINDLDFFFNDKKNYELALPHESLTIDIVYYDGENPYDTFDLSISQCYFNCDGNLALSPACQESYDTGIIKIIKDNLFHPRATLNRLYKYKHKYDLDIDPDDLKYVEDCHERAFHKLSGQSD